MHHNYFIFGLLLTCVLAGSCATNKLKLKDSTPFNSETTEENPSYTLYLIGDAGNTPDADTLPLLKALKKELGAADKNAAIIWLGDNIYPVGMPPQDHEDYPLARHRLLSQLTCHENYKGQAYFIPGNHDWYRYGSEGIRRQEAFIESHLSRNKSKLANSNFFIPDSACGKIHDIELKQGVSLILMDSNWYLQDDRSAFEHCPFADKATFLSSLDSLISLHKKNNIILALHHPPFTYGSHGARFTARDYLFPLTQIKRGIWLPLPFSGLIANQARAYLTEQDMKHPDYRILRETIDNALQDKKANFVVSGHDHNLQYIQRNNIQYIVSGAGSKQTAVGMGKDSRFAVAENGYARLQFFSNVILLEFVVYDKKTNGLTTVYKKNIPYVHE